MIINNGKFHPISINRLEKNFMMARFNFLFISLYLGTDPVFNWSGLYGFFNNNTFLWKRIKWSIL